MNNTRRIMRTTGLCSLMAMVMAAGSVSAAPLPTGMEAAGVAAAMSDGQEQSVPGSAGVAVSFNGDNLSFAESAEESAPEEHAAVAAMEARQAALEARYKDIAISQVDNYVNIRSDANAEAEVLGKIYNNSAAHILNTVEKEDGTWYQIRSGSVEGYIKSDFFVTGEEAEELAHEVGTMVATIKTETLRLREQPAMDSNTVSLLSMDEQYLVSQELGDYLELSIDTDLSGYVYSDYVDVNVEFKEAISLEEERAELERLAELERQRQEAEEAARREQEEQHSSSNSGSSNSGSSNSGSSNSSSSNSGSNNNRYEDDDEDYDYEDDEEDSGSSSSGSSSSGSSSSGSGSGSSIASYAESFVGAVPYVYGGNSLSSGVDCSGFVQQVFKQFGISLPRTSDSQGSAGYSVSSSEMRAGDIVYYGGHVAIYIGDGCVVHASNPETGVKISSWNYRTPISIRRVVD